MISVTILTKNSQETIEACLEALALFPEVIVLDTGSSDQTIELARAFPNVKVHETPFTGFGEMHNVATSHATYDWVLSLDSDEVLSEETVKEIFIKQLESKTVYSLPFRNFFRGKHIRSCGWYPEEKVRLYNRLETRFTDELVHEKIDLRGMRVERLNGWVDHYSYRRVDDFLTKMQRYSTLFADQHGKKASVMKAIFKSWAAFFKSFILKKGFLDGREGYIISRYNADVTYYKYLKVAVHGPLQRD